MRSTLRGLGKRSLPFLLGIVCLRLTLLHAQTPAAAATDSAKLQGTWSMVSGTMEGQPMPASYAQTMKRVAVGNEVIITMGAQTYFKATIHLDPTQTPRAIDYHMTAGPTIGATQLGIYAIMGDTVRFCFAAPNKPRPTDFTSTPGDARLLSTWVRVKP